MDCNEFVDADHLSLAGKMSLNQFPVTGYYTVVVSLLVARRQMLRQLIGCVYQGHGVDRISEPRRLQRLSEAVPQHHLWSTSHRRPSRGQSTRLFVNEL